MWTFLGIAFFVFASGQSTGTDSSSDGSNDPDGCTLPENGIGGICGGAAGFAIAQCGNMKIQAQFNVSSFSCASKTQAELDACADEIEAGSTPSDSCKVNTMSFKVEGENAEGSTWGNIRTQSNHPVPLASYCNGNISSRATDWFLTATDLMLAHGSVLCTPARADTSRRLLAKAATQTVMFTRGAGGGTGGGNVQGTGTTSTGAFTNALSTTAACTPMVCEAVETCPNAVVHARRRNSPAPPSGATSTEYNCPTAQPVRTTSKSVEKSAVRRLLQKTKKKKNDEKSDKTTESKTDEIKKTSQKTTSGTTVATGSTGSSSVRRRTLTLYRKMSAGFQWNCATSIGCVGQTYTTSALHSASTILDGDKGLNCAAAVQGNKCTFGQENGPSMQMQQRQTN